MLFTDEKKFSLVSETPIKVWRKAGEKLERNCLQRSIQRSPSILVWGAISKHKPLCLIKIEGTLDSDAYCSQVSSIFASPNKFT